MSEQVALLKRIRDMYYDIQMITMHCCSDISYEAILDMIKERTELMNLIAAEKQMLSDNECNDASSIKSLREEIKKIISTILSLDRQVETVIKNHMKKLQADLVALQKTSRAVSAYAVQSRV